MTTKLRIKMNETAGLKNFLQILNKVGKISQLNFIIGAYDTNNETMKKIESKVQKTEEHYLKIKLNRFCEFLDNEDSLIWGVFIGCDEDNELHIDNNIVSEGAPDDLQAENGITEARVNDG